ncbi:threonine ammonia-lyase [Georgenia sp. Z1491]|uniref:threonine ammonia-lyase n=1 Tax=Georgenia sp. Z1491 TaxID=3416707 RepID=UPI003CFA1252
MTAEPAELPPGLPTLDELDAARAIVRPVARETPVLSFGSLAEHTGAPVHLKAEHLQRTGSFKIRGAAVRLGRLDAAERERGVIAASAGNHAQGVALAARELGVPARIYMPADAALPKVEATRAYGAEVVLTGRHLMDCLAEAEDDCAASGRTLIHPYDHIDIVLGAASVGLEILEQVPDVATIVVPTGGGGLLAGIAAAAHAVRPGVRVVGVQAAKAAAWPASLADGRPVPLTEVRTMADGIAVGTPGTVPFGIVHALVEDVRTVGEEELSRALLLMVERAKLVVEPSGAAGVAAVTGRPRDFSDGPTVVVLSGGNVDPLLLLRVVRHGLASAGRFVSLRVRVPDAPGTLAGILALLGDLGANVASVEHSRTAPGLAVDEVEISVEVETKGPEHGEEIRAALAADGTQVLDG